MSRKKLVRLTWIDETGTAYHEADHTPTVAKELLKRAGMFVIDFPGTSYGHPLTAFSRAAVERSSRGVIAKGERTIATERQKHVLVTLPEDNSEQEAK